MKRLFFLIVLLVVLSCRRDQHAEPACDPNKSFTAGFKIGDYLGGRFFETDTLVNFMASFEAEKFYYSYEWTVEGSSLTLRAKSFTMRFPESLLGSTLWVQLIAKGDKNPCNPTDDGMDTVRKQFTILYPRELNHYYPNELLTSPTFLGKWRGVFEDQPKDTFVVTINNNGEHPNYVTDRFYGFRIYNLPKGCSVKQERGVSSCESITDTIQKYFGYPVEMSSFNSFYTGANGMLTCCPIATLYGAVNKAGDSIRVEYITNSSGIASTRFFLGKRL